LIDDQALKPIATIDQFIIRRSYDSHPMTFHKRLSTTLAAIVCLSMATGAMAQDLTPSTTRGTVKVQSRVFNPFDVSRSRLTIDPFGFFTVQKPTQPSGPVPLVISSEKPATVTSLPAGLANTNSTSTTSAAAPATTIGTSSAVLDPTEVIAVGAARPPFRPPVRSPFRPPPRPPF
jgi:hypothetical protein